MDALHRLENGEPLQYLLGEWEFYGLPLAVGPGVLIPRADTETIVETCLLALAPVPDPAIWDLCSGSGAIALALASRRPDARILAAELSEEALPYLRQNIAALAPDQVTAVQTDVLTQLPDGLCDLIVSNPPYITGADMQTLGPRCAGNRNSPSMAGRTACGSTASSPTAATTISAPAAGSSSRSATTRGRASPPCSGSVALTRCSAGTIWLVYPGVPVAVAHCKGTQC